MTATAAARQTGDPPPLWMPRQENLVLDGLRRSRQSSIEGVSSVAQLRALLLGAPRTALGRIGALLGTIALVAMLPALAERSSWGNLGRVGGYHLWTMILLLVASASIRSVSTGRALRHVLTGALAVVAVVYFLAGPITDLSGIDRRAVWVIPPLEEIAKAIPLIFAVLAGRRFWRHPGLTDLLLLGFAVGAGFAFHEDALWGRVAASGFDGPAGVVVPSLVRTGASVVIGHAGWTALIGFAIGLLVLHRHQPLAVTTAGVLILAVTLDHMSINDGRQRLGWVRDILYDGNALVVALFASFVAAPILDLRRLKRVRERDHLFGPGSAGGDADRFAAPPGDSEAIRALRYLRLRNGAHTAIAAHGEHRWPTAGAEHDHVVTALALAARDAGVPARLQHLDGWELDPEGVDTYRFRNGAGWTKYVSDGDSADLGATSLRPDARVRIESGDRDPQFWRTTLILVGVVVTAAVLRLLTIDDAAPGGVEFVLGNPDGVPGGAADAFRLSLPDAPAQPPLLRTLLGSPVIFPCSDLGLDDLDGPPEDPEQPEQCEQA